MKKKIRPIVSQSVNGFFKGYKDVIKDKIDRNINETLKKYMREDRDQVISECSKRAADLDEHSKMWIKAGGVGGRMALDALSEIKHLNGIIDDLENGTTDYLASLYDEKVKYLEYIKSKAGLVDAVDILYINKAIKETLKRKEEVLIELENRKQKSK